LERPTKPGIPPVREAATSCVKRWSGSPNQGARPAIVYVSSK
jgi:hypothetical protein